MKHPVPYTNNAAHAMHIGTVCILPGETRPVDPDMLPGAGTEPEPAEASQPDERHPELIPLLDGNVSDLIAGLPQLDAEDLEALEVFERMGKNRKTALDAITEERLKRAAA